MTAGRTRVLAMVAVAWLALFALGTLITEGHGTVGLVLSNVIYLVPHTLAVGLAIWAARRADGEYRRVWTMLACALPLWLAGELIVSFYHVVLEREPPFPGIADAFFLTFYLALIATFVVALRPALMVRSWKAVLDGSVLAVAVGFIGWIAVVEPQLSQPASLATFTGVAYPTLDVAMLTILVSLTLASFRRPPLALGLLTGAIFVGGLTDVALTYVSLHTTSPELSWLKIGWEAEALLLAFAALAALQPGGPAHRPDRQDVRDRGLTIVLVGVAATLAVVVFETLHATFTLDAGIVALYVVGAIALRLHLTSREREQIAMELATSLLEQERMANTDELTGLRNRRYADRHLKDETRPGRHVPGPETAVLILDLDHFKEINDSHGHPGGDEVLRLAARRLSAAARPGDVVARYGGEEFLVILHDIDRDGLPAVAERFRECIAEEPFEIGAEQPSIVTVSVGGASMPADAATLTELLRIADRALYTAKYGGRNRVQIGRQSDESSIEGLMERGSVLNFVQALVDYVDAGYGALDHGNHAARWAGLVADELGLDAAQRWRATAAARLHDIGKIGVAPELLVKPRPLDRAEWDLIRRHPGVGADILSLAPGLDDVAEIVREHHERFDGSGYPAGLAAEEISIEARIVSVCDTWVAMRSDRAHRSARGEAEAEAELRAVAGRQLDPHVVDAFFAARAHRGDLALLA